MYKIIKAENDYVIGTCDRLADANLLALLSSIDSVTQVKQDEYLLTIFHDGKIVYSTNSPQTKQEIITGLETMLRNNQ